MKSLAPRIERARPDRFTFVEAKREMFDIGVYTVALVRWLTGREISTVDAVTSKFFFQEHDQAGVEDFGIMIFDLEGGVSATIAAGRFGWTSHPAGGPLKIVLVGANGTFTFDAHNPKFELHTDEAPFAMPKRHCLTQWALGVDATGIKRHEEESVAVVRPRSSGPACRRFGFYQLYRK